MQKLYKHEKDKESRRQFSLLKENTWRTIRWKGTRRKCCSCGQVEQDEFRIVEIGGKRFLEIRGKLLKKGRKP